MTHILVDLFYVILDTVWDVLPIASIIFGFQFLILRKPIPNLKRILTGFLLVLLGLGFFLEGLQAALFPLGKLMAHQLTNSEFIAGEDTDRVLQGWEYYWVYLFAFAIGFATTIAEPSLLAVAIKANEVSAGAIGTWGLRIAVAIGVAIGIGLGAAFPDFKVENPLQAVTSFGGFLFMVICAGFIGAVIVLEAGPVYRLFMAGIHGRALTLLEWVWAAGSFAAALSLSLSAIYFPMRFGEKKLNEGGI